MKSRYELKANDEDEEWGAAPSDDEDGSEDKSDSSSDNNNNNIGPNDDDNNIDSDVNSGKSYDSPFNGDDWGEPPSDREDEDTDLFYEEYDSNVDYYDEDIKDDAEANRWSNADNDPYRLINVLENVREENAQANQMYHDEYPYGHLLDWSDITNVSSRSGPMNSDYAYSLALNVFISEIGKETLNNKELKHGYIEPIIEETQCIDLGTDDEPKMI